MVYSSAGYPRSAASASENQIARWLSVAVTVLGVAAYGLSFGPVANDAGATGWNVRFAALAALCAAFGLLPRQKPLPFVTAVLAVMGLLDAVSAAVTYPEPGWATTAIVVVNALQAVVAVVALLRARETASDGAAAGYEAYVDYYNQAVRNYYGQQAQPSAPQQSQRSGYGQAHADAAGSGSARAQRSSQYADYTDFDYGGARGQAPGDHDTRRSAGRSTGLPSAGQAHDYADTQRRDRGEAPPPPASPF